MSDTQTYTYKAVVSEDEHRIEMVHQGQDPMEAIEAQFSKWRGSKFHLVEVEVTLSDFQFKQSSGGKFGQGDIMVPRKREEKVSDPIQTWVWGGDKKGWE